MGWKQLIELLSPGAAVGDVAHGLGNSRFPPTTFTGTRRRRFAGGPGLDGVLTCLVFVGLLVGPDGHDLAGTSERMARRCQSTISRASTRL